jgi:hypothetical protein
MKSEFGTDGRGGSSVQRRVRPLACPFCNAAPVMSVTRYRRELKMKPLWYLRCENKSCPVDVRVFNLNKRQLLADWNKRSNGPDQR